jgi:hypothetical protein
MATVSVESSLFDQVWGPAGAWRMAADQSPRGKVKACQPSRPHLKNLLVIPPRRREEDSERWDGLA